MQNLQAPSSDIDVSLQSSEVEKITKIMTVVVAALVSRHEAVSISAIEKGNEIVLAISVAVEDVGKVLGKQARTARSLRTIFGAITAPMVGTFSLDIANSRADQDG